MRLFFKMLLVGAIVFAAGTAWAQTKIGIVDMQAIIAESVPGEQAMGELRTRFETMKEELDKQNEAITKLRDELQRQSMVLSQEAKQDKEQEYRRVVRDFQEQFQAFQAKMRTEEDRLSEPILELLIKVINDYGARHNYSLIMDGTSAGLVYADDAVVITNAIKDELNKAWQAR
ncbi:OmpH family outer membrane protein [Desulfonatronum thioautotrophicum]|uniref:OmpH family outer membrane protein n=1 Tax=Desulfonatronum thioautotrophicum TaxID=617001 RepID=UPI00069AB2F3|nr:OmpH family outer membrane protein [Desulfonatronum thioautotrophicum]